MNHGCASLGLIAASLFAPLQAMAMTEDEFHAIADQVFGPVMAEHAIPGMAIGVTMNGRHFVHTAGLANRETGAPVETGTLFELGSISKTFNATLAALAQERGLLSLEDRVSAHLPALEGSAFGALGLMDLATHQTGGLPLQVPDGLSTDAELTEWLAGWQPATEPGRERSYSNISVGLLGRISGQAFGQGYAEALRQHLLAPLGLRDTHVDVPPEARPRYAYGYSRDGDRPIRVNPGMLDAEAYGIKSSAADMLLFLDAALGHADLPDDLRHAIATTHAGRTRTAHFDQAMIWERYDWPADHRTILAGNGAAMVMESQPARRLDTPTTAAEGVLLGKTGSTNGFGGYAALIPDRDFGIVVLANRNYPVPARVEASLRMAEQLLEADGL